MIMTDHLRSEFEIYTFIYSNIKIEPFFLIILIIKISITNFRVGRQSCYMVRADELYNEVTQDASGKGASQGMFVGCFVDTATGWVTYTCEGKETSHKFKMEPDTKLFPAIFVEATSKEILQIELCRT